MRARGLAVLLGLALAAPRIAAAQEGPPRITTRVQQVAGASLYLNVGTQNGLMTGDTLTVSRAGAGAPMGRLVVLASSDTRSLLTFAGRPFPVTRGTSLVLQLLRQPADTPHAVGMPAAALSAAPPTRSRAPTPPAHGRISFRVSGVHSATTIGGTDPLTVDRMFATPTTGLDLTVPNAVGPFRLRTSMNLAYRYSNQDIVEPAMVARVYTASLEGDFRRVRLQLGRFHSPLASYGGFWDGALLRVGGSGFGLGAIAGLEPDRWDERPSLSTPKATVFLDAAGRGAGWRWSGNLAVQAVRPTNGEPDHTFFDTSERLSSGPLRISHEIQVDRDPVSGEWRVSRFRLRASAQVAARLNIHGGVGRLEPWLPGFAGSAFGLRSDRADAGLDVQTGHGFIGVDGFLGRDAFGGSSHGATGTFMVNRLPGLAVLGASGSLSWWSGGFGTTLSAAPSVSVNLSRAWFRFGYRLNRSDYLRNTILTRAVDASVDFPFASGFRASAHLQVQLGGALSSQSFDLGFYEVF